jgi:DNA-binding transcriptional MocR family regulator
MAKLYEKVASQVADLVGKGVYNYGERVPSVRELSRELEVSTTTVVEAYRLLEDQGMLEARPQSGYYVRVHETDSRCPIAHCPKPTDPIPVSVSDMIVSLLRDQQRQGLVRLAGADAAADLLPVKALQKCVSNAVRDSDCLTEYDPPPGCRELRQAVAKRATLAGCQFSPDDLVLTTGAQEALTLCLRAVCSVGDVVAIESPTFFGQLQAIEMLGLRVLEIPSDPRSGISLDALALAIDQMPVKAVVATPSHSNPSGSCMTTEARRELVEMTSRAAIPLIEDDVYGELGYGLKRLPAAKAFDRDGGVLYCSSLSKTLAPGYRLGWAAPGRYRDQVQRLKTLTNLASPSVLALGVARYLQGSAFDRTLRQMRREYARRSRAMRESVLAHFPEGTRVSDPRGSYVLWVELPRHFDTLKLYPKAKAEGVVFAPGPMFSAGRRYHHCLRLNAATWGVREQQAVEVLGRLLNQE